MTTLRMGFTSDATAPLTLRTEGVQGNSINYLTLYLPKPMNHEGGKAGSKNLK